MSSGNVTAETVLKWALPDTGTGAYASQLPVFKTYAGAIDVTSLGSFSLDDGLKAFLKGDDTLKEMVTHFKNKHKAEFDLYIKVEGITVTGSFGDDGVTEVLDHMVDKADDIQKEIKTFIGTLKPEDANTQLNNLFPPSST